MTFRALIASAAFAVVALVAGAASAAPVPPGVTYPAPPREKGPNEAWLCGTDDRDHPSYQTCWFFEKKDGKVTTNHSGGWVYTLAGEPLPMVPETPVTPTAAPQQLSLAQLEEVKSFNGMHRGGCTHDADIDVVSGWNQVGGGTDNQICVKKPSVSEKLADLGVSVIGLFAAGEVIHRINENSYGSGYYYQRGGCRSMGPGYTGPIIPC